MSGEIAVKDGAIYIPAQVADTYFRGIESVIVLIQEGELLIMPVHQVTSGGCLLKLRNAAGDRVAQARDVFQDREMLDFSVEKLPTRWESEKGALCATFPESAN
ncbi:MAG: hypothetical protein JKY00_16230 [Roseicyclus sp.]|nr:hypothetical protein [Roseicyclus sp.]